MKKALTLLGFFTTIVLSVANAQCDPPTGLAASYNNNVSTFSWNAVTGATNYRMQIRFLGAASWGTTELTVNSPYTLTGLMQGMDFEWRIRTNCNGTMSSYTTSQYTTPCPQPSGLNTTAISSNAATLNWIAAPGYNTNISDFTVSYRLANTTNAWIQLGHTFATSKNVTGLLPGTAYEWRVNQNCANYNSSFSTAQFTTAALPCNAPTGLSAVYNNNVTTFSWNGVSNAVDYTLQIKYPGYSWTEIEYETNISSSPLTLTGIIQSGTFDWRVRTNCNNGSSAYTQSQVTIPCPQPSGPNTTNITTTGATVNWTPAPGLNTLISDFVVSYRLAGSGNNWTQAGHTFGSSMNISGLTPGTAYEWRVYQTCPYFNSSVVTSQFTTISANGCGFPSTISLSNIGNTSAVLDWSAVGTATLYTLYFKKTGTTSWSSVNVFGTTYTWQNLLMNTTYEYYMRTKCGNNYSNYSPLSSFTTLNCVTYGTNNSEWIDRFKLGSIDRLSGAESGGYINTGLTTNLVIGSSNNGVISAGFPGAVRNQGYAVYIDFNRNGRYDDAGERVFGVGSIANAGNSNFVAIIPATATPGVTGMRVVMRKSSDGTVAPCLTGFLGEAEDYLVTLVTSSSRGIQSSTTPTEIKQNNISIGPNPSNGIFTVTLPGETAIVSYEVINTNGMIVQKGSMKKVSLFNIDLSAMANGMYILKITDAMGIQQVQKLIRN